MKKYLFEVTSRGITCWCSLDEARIGLRLEDRVKELLAKGHNPQGIAIKVEEEP